MLSWCSHLLIMHKMVNKDVNIISYLALQWVLSLSKNHKNKIIRIRTSKLNLFWKIWHPAVHLTQFNLWVYPWSFKYLQNIPWISALLYFANHHGRNFVTERKGEESQILSWTTQKLMYLAIFCLMTLNFCNI